MTIKDIDERLFDYYLNSVHVLKFGDFCTTKRGAPARYIDGGKALTNDLVIDDAVAALDNERFLPRVHGDQGAERDCNLPLPDDKTLERAKAFIENRL